jgi:uncharacterized damage-inducible protein DinB
MSMLLVIAAPHSSRRKTSAKVVAMQAMLENLIRHKGYADASLLRAIRQHDRAAQDNDLRRLLHHIILANRFWLMQTLSRPFPLEEESRAPESLEEVTGRYREAHTQELEWITNLDEAHLGRKLESPFIPGGSCSVADGMMQVCMHSHGHRSQCASRLRLLGGTPPALDFILWLKERPAADWS